MVSGTPLDERKLSNRKKHLTRIVNAASTPKKLNQALLDFATYLAATKNLSKGAAYNAMFYCISQYLPPSDKKARDLLPALLQAAALRLEYTEETPQNRVRLTTPLVQL